MPVVQLKIFAVLALLIPALALVSKGGGVAVFYTLAVLASLAIMVYAGRGRAQPSWRDLAWPGAVLAVPLLSMLVTNAYLGIWSGSEFEKLLRFALALPLFWVLLCVPRPWLQQIQWSLLFSAYAGAIMLYVIVGWYGGRMQVSFYGAEYNAVAFANLTLFFGFASLLTLGWRLTPWPRLEALLKVGAACAAVYAAHVSETRSSWMLLPVFGLVFLMSRRVWSLRRKLAVGLVLVAALAVLVGAMLSSQGNRMHKILTDLQRYTVQNDRNTSVGIRLQLWHASWMIFQEAPVLGVGPRNFRTELAKLRDRGVVTPEVASGYGEPHNDFMAAMAGYGLLGLLSMLALYLAPAWVFLRRMASDDRVIRTGAQIGLLFCLGYCAFSLTEMMFRNMRSVPIYSATLVLLLALTAPRAPRAA
ncbi:O-antigen ligase [Bordetella bronchiseptica E014]|uniref:O-antigen ligase family protein n=1 Tax=Bordetella bronchiseptica TaxID=518 RepID=UPI0002901946|nr:O-antigen ligase family protein [Bordetella bronchiseptica]KDD56005.1 O-antigen ligase [Bordetella bronchiseptica OSU553]AWP60032.1 hypothetical protein B7P02_19240 [Bordetella bronchiseptica]AWQ06725.1 hypothetical protein B9G73_18985 [Bordetella bronchiseptica]KAK67136.1 O-antigen ligase [Bordetella bronchiseptica MO211]KAK77874.1 O-antigen ligase [Bordetella bronchiseptica CA90 BB02]